MSPFSIIPQNPIRINPLGLLIAIACATLPTYFRAQRPRSVQEEQHSFQFDRSRGWWKYSHRLALEDMALKR